MKQLIERCKRAIAEQRCLGCVGLAEKDWIPPKVCPNLLTAKQSINQIKLKLDIKGENNENM